MSLTILMSALAVPAFAQPKPGSVDQEIPAGPIGDDDAASTRVDRERDSGGGEAPGPLDLDGARIGYAVRGGLLAADNLLLIEDDGRVHYVAKSSVDPLNFTIETTISQNHVRTLKLLMKKSGFASMPDRFEPDGVVIDGVALGVAARMNDGSSKTVWSETAAIESESFTQLRKTLDALVLELTSRETLAMKSFDSAEPTLERSFRLKADGSFRIEMIESGEPVSWVEGRLSAADREAIETSLAKFDFAGSRLCRSEAGSRIEHELFVTLGGERRAVQFSEGSDDPALLPLLDIARTIKLTASQAGL
jgi:hypothetical protein